MSAPQQAPPDPDSDDAPLAVHQSRPDPDSDDAPLVVHQERKRSRPDSGADWVYDGKDDFFDFHMPACNRRDLLRGLAKLFTTRGQFKHRKDYKEPGRSRLAFEGEAFLDSGRTVLDILESTHLSDEFKTECSQVQDGIIASVPAKER